MKERLRVTVQWGLGIGVAVGAVAVTASVTLPDSRLAAAGRGPIHLAVFYPLTGVVVGLVVGLMFPLLSTAAGAGLVGAVAGWLAGIGVAFLIIGYPSSLAHVIVSGVVATVGVVSAIPWRSIQGCELGPAGPREQDPSLGHDRVE